jgi:hypothetical protein
VDGWGGAGGPAARDSQAAWRTTKQQLKMKPGDQYLTTANRQTQPARQVPDEAGRPAPFRLAYSRWLTEWVLKLDPQACDELLILARGKT